MFFHIPHSLLSPSSGSFFVNSDLILSTAGKFLSPNASSSNGLKLLGGLEFLFKFSIFSSSGVFLLLSAVASAAVVAAYVLWSLSAPIIPAFSNSLLVNSVSSPLGTTPPVNPDKYIESYALRPYVRV